MSHMEVAVFRDLPGERAEAWSRFLSESKHTHPEQDIRFASVLRAAGNDVVFVMGWIDEVLRSVALFSLSPHPFLKGYYREAMAFSGPVCDDPNDLLDVPSLMISYPLVDLPSSWQDRL